MLAKKHTTEDRDLEILAARAKRLTERSDGEAETKKLTSILIFSLGEESFAARMTAVSAVIPIQKLTPVPTADSRILGILPFKGEVHTIFELSDVLALPKVESTDPGYAMILRLSGLAVGVRVGRIEAIDHVDDASYHAPLSNKLTGKSFVKPIENEALILIEDFQSILGTLIYGDTAK